jgi:hypothetical protein
MKTSLIFQAFTLSASVFGAIGELPSWFALYFVFLFLAASDFFLRFTLGFK